jgi:hypothetical protein
MKKILTFLFVAVLFSITATAQDSSALATSSAVAETQNVQGEIIEYPSEALFKSMTASLAKSGRAVGVINSDGSIYVIGEATSARPSNMPGFIRSKNNAYNIAEMQAKMRLLQMAGEQITSGRGYHLLQDIIEGEDPDAAQIAQEMKDAIDKKETGRQDFQMKISSLVTGMMQGCAVVRIAEGEMGNDDYQVAVCIKYSPEYQSMASLMKAGGLGQVPTGAAKASREKVVNTPESDLVYKMGSWVTYDENGNMVVYGYGQEEVRETETRTSAAMTVASSKARLYAVNNVKNFVAEDMICKEVIDDVEKLRDYSDGSQAYFSRSKFQQAVEARSSTLNIATQNVRTWRSVHPVSGTTVVGAIVCWTYENAAAARQLRQQIDNNSRAVNGSGSKVPRQQTTKGRIVITGDDDDL